MSLNYAPSEVTEATYQRIFDEERQQSYPMVDAFEARMGYAINRKRLEGLACVLSCPFKAAKPNWQHGRVIYAVARKFLEGKPSGCWTFLDIGTAKGFSAMCLQTALNDHAGARTFGVTSVDVLPPAARVRRNTVSEVDGLKTLAEILAPWHEAEDIAFIHSTGIEWLTRNKMLHVDVAFVDGKHSGEVVRKEGGMLADRQERGDVVIFDDVHIPEVGQAVESLKRQYELEKIQVLPKRAYAIGRRK